MAPVYDLICDGSYSGYAFADDWKLALAFTIEPTHAAQVLVYKRVSECVNRLRNWMDLYRLQLNISKLVHFLVFPPRRVLRPLTAQTHHRGSCCRADGLSA